MARIDVLVHPARPVVPRSASESILLSPAGSELMLRLVFDGSLSRMTVRLRDGTWSAWTMMYSGVESWDLR